MSKAAANKIVAGLEDALAYASVSKHVRDWIREDAPMAAKLTLHPEHVSKLVDRICGSRTHQPK